MDDAMAERARIVAWLREKAALLDADIHFSDEATEWLNLATQIERGDHDWPEIGRMKLGPIDGPVSSPPSRAKS